MGHELDGLTVGESLRGMQLLSSDGCGWAASWGWEVRGSGERLFAVDAFVRGGPGGGVYIYGGAGVFIVSGGMSLHSDHQG